MNIGNHQVRCMIHHVSPSRTSEVPTWPPCAGTGILLGFWAALAGTEDLGQTSLSGSSFVSTVHLIPAPFSFMLFHPGGWSQPVSNPMSPSPLSLVFLQQMVIRVNLFCTLSVGGGASLWLRTSISSDHRATLDKLCLSAKVQRYN